MLMSDGKVGLGTTAPVREEGASGVEENGFDVGAQHW